MVQCLYANQVLYCFCICLKLWIKSGFCLCIVIYNIYTNIVLSTKFRQQIPQNSAVMQATKLKTRKLSNYFLINYVPKYNTLKYLGANICIITFTNKVVLCLQCFISKINKICGANTANIKNWSSWAMG